MNRRALVVAGAVVLAGVLVVGGFGFAYEIYLSQQHCQQMDARREITANCWAFPNRFLVAGGVLFGVVGLGLAVASVQWYRTRAEQTA